MTNDRTACACWRFTRPVPSAFSPSTPQIHVVAHRSNTVLAYYCKVTVLPSAVPGLPNARVERPAHRVRKLHGRPEPLLWRERQGALENFRDHWRREQLADVPRPTVHAVVYLHTREHPVDQRGQRILVTSGDKTALPRLGGNSIIVVRLDTPDLSRRAFGMAHETEAEHGDEGTTFIQENRVLAQASVENAVTMRIVKGIGYLCNIVTDVRQAKGPMRRRERLTWAPFVFRPQDGRLTMEVRDRKNVRMPQLGETTQTCFIRVLPWPYCSPGR